MNNFLLVTRVLLKNNFFSQFGIKNKKESKKGYKILLLIILTLLLGSVVIPLAYSSYESVLLMPDLGELFIRGVIPTSGLVVLVFGFYSIMSIFFFSKDNDALLHLPISGRDILLAKFFVSLISTYFLLFLIVLPILVGVGLAYGSFLYFVYLMLVFMFLPVIPSVLVAFIILLLMGLFNLTKYKNIFAYLFSFIGILFIFAYSFGMQFFYESQSLLEGQPLLIFDDYLSSLFPLLNPASEALVHYSSFFGFASLILFISSNVVSILILYFLGDKLFLKALLKNEKRKNKLKDLEKTIKDVKKRNNFSNLFLKEWVDVKRTPVYVLNLLSALFLIPLVMLISIYGSYFLNDESIGDLLDYSYFSHSLIFLISYVFLVFIISTSPISATSISREGKNAWFLKILPISLFKQILVKISFGFLIGMIAIFIIILIATLIFSIPIYFSLSLFLAIIPTCFFLNLIGISIDLKRPSLNWSSENEAVKQNLNVLIFMLLSFVYIVFISFSYWLALKYFGSINIPFILLIIILINSIFIALNLFCLQNLEKKGKILEDIN